MKIDLAKEKVRILRLYLEKALIDAKGMSAIGFSNKSTIRNIKSIIRKINQAEIQLIS